MKIFQRLKSVKASHLLLGAAFAAVFGVGRLSKKAEVDGLKERFAGKEKVYQEKIKKLTVAANPFRFYDYDRNGVRISELDRVKKEEMPEEFKDRFGKYRTKEIAPAEIVRLDSIRHKKGEKTTFPERNPARLKELELRLSDTISVYGDEEYLKAVREYRNLVMEEMRVMSKKRKGFDFRLFKLNDEQLKEVVKEYPIVEYLKYTDEPYPQPKELYKQQKDAYLAQKILEMRSFIRVNNAVVEDMKMADSLLFNNAKEFKIEKIEEEAKAKKDPLETKYLMNFYPQKNRY